MTQEKDMYECLLNIHVLATFGHRSPAEICELQARILRMASELSLEDVMVDITCGDVHRYEGEEISPLLQEPS